VYDSAATCRFSTEHARSLPRCCRFRCRTWAVCRFQCRFAGPSRRPRVRSAGTDRG